MAKRGVPTHPKTFRLARSIDYPVWAAVGLLECFWHWCSRHAITGLIKAGPEEIAFGIGWTSDPNRLVDSLVNSGWVDRYKDGSLVVHDLQDHADNTWRANLKRAGLSFYVPENKELASETTQKITTESQLSHDSVTTQSQQNHDLVTTESQQNHNSVVNHQSLEPEPEPQPEPIPPISPPRGTTTQKDEPKPKKDLIEQIYQAYPRKVGKPKALKAIERALRGGVDENFLLQAVQKYSGSPKVRSQIENGEKEFIPHPATWFNQERWTDDPSEWGYDNQEQDGSQSLPSWTKEKSDLFWEEQEKIEGKGGP